jgi:excisionase family DNA binding protein
MAFRLGNNPSGNGVDKVILNGVVQRGTDYELNTRNYISLQLVLLGPDDGSFFSLHRGTSCRYLPPAFVIRQPATDPSKELLYAVQIGKPDRIFPENHGRLTEIQSAFIEHSQKQPSQLDFRDLAQELIMSASQPSRFAPSPSQSRPRTEFVFEPLLDSDEAAQLLRIHPKTLQRMARNRQIHGIQVGKLWRFRASDLEGWLKMKRAG